MSKPLLDDKFLATRKSKENGLDGTTLVNQIRSVMSSLSTYHEKQQFLKTLYADEKTAIKLGVFPTPGEVVNFLIEGTDILLQKYFRKKLSDTGVEILDPCVGTGTFLTALIDWIPVDKLEFKYNNELYGNEVASLPYYVATQNIECLYHQRTGQNKPFGNLSLTDTLENLEPASKNDHKISVILGNPPYYANQWNENENNKNRSYPAIDARIRETYVKHSRAQKTKCYDIYIRFIRWASDRLEKNPNKNGIIAFISNNSFLNSKNTDGVRGCLGEEFNTIWVLNLKGDARTKGEARRKEGGNIFENAIREGVAIYFLVKSEEKRPFEIHYATVDDYLSFQEKRYFLHEHSLQNIPFTRLIPDRSNNWTKVLPERPEFQQFMPLLHDKQQYKNTKEGLIATFSSKGISTNRDGWVYDFNKDALREKIQYFTATYNETVQRVARGELTRKDGNLKEILLSQDEASSTIKWSDTLFRKLAEQRIIQFDPANIVQVHYRPFVIKYLYPEKCLLDRLTKNHFRTWGKDLRVENKVIVISTGGTSKLFEIFCSKIPIDLHFNGDSTYIPLYSIDNDGKYVENLTDRVVAQFSHLDKFHPSPKKEDIFNYIYGILHDPVVLNTYSPYFLQDAIRIPIYDEYWLWVDWGQKLLEMHLNYDSLPPFPLQRIEIPLRGKRGGRRTILMSDPPAGVIKLDSTTSLEDIPSDAWNYKIGSQSAIDIVLSHYKERKIREKTLNTKYNSYRFADFKESVIILLQKVVTLSLNTRAIIGEMQKVSHNLLLSERKSGGKTKRHESRDPCAPCERPPQFRPTRSSR